jgi:branched-chain amino acid transport system ATP-binding protein
VAQRARLGLGRSFQISSLIPEYSARRNVMLALQARQGHSYRFLAGDARPQPDRPARAILPASGWRARQRALGELAHGERRLLEIAVALALEPAAFLLDEPMAGHGRRRRARLTAFLDGCAPRRRSCWSSTTWTRFSRWPTGSRCWPAGG